MPWSLQAMLNLSPYRPLELSDREFELLSRLIYTQCGIHLTAAKKELVKARLGKRIRNGPFRTFQEYYQFVLNDETGEELTRLLDSITTNFTFFFREKGHFDYLREVILPEWVSQKKGRGRKIRIWSAACSSGEEPYSIAMTLLEGIENPPAWEISVLGTDLSTRALKTAEAGIFPKERLQPVPPPLIKKYFLKGEDQWKDFVKVKEEVRRLVQFKRLNLMEPFQFAEPFDCIFCRNVMIYFDKKIQAELVNRLYECLERGGFLLIGHSESLTGIVHPFRYIRPAIYRKME
ncbi:MAG: protein-glutamate O-methyltransferase CheR [Desulfobacterota bacterium]|nr:protein-glutamate O-methyltransferase CheR [Thermodesulfobacteriota bacterium]